MILSQIIGIVLIVLGILGAIYQSFTYIRRSHKTTLGNVEMAVREKERVYVPLWVSVLALLLGIILIVFK